MDPATHVDAVRNVGVKDGRIAAITQAEIQGAETIDASGHVVAPGFIDIHCHGQDPYTTKLLLRDGVTTPLEIEAGAWPVEDYYNEREGKSQANYGTSVGHVWARISAMDGVNPKGLGLYSDAINATVADHSRWSTERADEDQLKTIMGQGRGRAAARRSRDRHRRWVLHRGR